MATDGPQESTAAAARQQTWLMRAIGLFGLLLIAVTWRLWTPQVVFPQVPLIRAAGSLPSWLEWSLLAVMIGTLASVLAGPRSIWQPAKAAFVVATAVMIAVDQHRLQPWAYQLIILNTIGLVFSPISSLRLARLLLISIYFFSAISKFDHQFLHTLGQQFLETLLGFASVSTSHWSETARMVAAGIFPLGELLIACGLMLPRIQRPAAWLGICLHVVLILILGPIGLKHHLGVLIWNLFFIAQLAILFLASRGQQSLCEWSSFRQASLSDKLAVLCVLGLVVAPLAEPLGCIDHWPAWQLYAPRNSRVTMRIFASAVEKLPAELRQHVKPGDGGPLVRVDLDGWSLTSLSAPIYPQDRFQLGVAAAVARDYALGGAVVVTRQGVANRWTGRRNEVILRGSARILEEIDGFRLNAQPR